MSGEAGGFFHPSGTLRAKKIPSGSVRAENQRISVRAENQLLSDQFLLDTLLSALARVSSQLYVDPAMVWAAHRLVQNQPNLSPNQIREATLVVLALLTAISQGSSRVPLNPHNYLDTLLASFEEALRQEDISRGHPTRPGAPNEHGARLPDGGAPVFSPADQIADIRANNPARSLIDGPLKDALSVLLRHAKPGELPYYPLLVVEDESAQLLTTERMLRRETRLAQAFLALLATKPSGRPGAAYDAESALADIISRPTYYRSAGYYRSAQKKSVDLDTAPQNSGLSVSESDLDVQKNAPRRDVMGENAEIYDELRSNSSKIDENIEKSTGKNGAWHPQTLNNEQLRAVEVAITRPLALVTGGPGTGKTTIVVAIMRALVRLGIAPEKIALAAPTGKAAYRMRESATEQLDTLDANVMSGPNRDSAADSISRFDRQLRRDLPQARTLHRLLGYSPKYDFFRRNKKNRLEAEVVICDEASMIDLSMMHALIEALPDGARLILVGDAEQLPPIGGGAPFRDLLAARAPKETQQPERMQQPERTQPQKNAHSDESSADGAFDLVAADGPAPTIALSESSAIQRTPAMAAATAMLNRSYRMDGSDPHGKQILELAAAVRNCERADDPRLDQFLGNIIDLDKTTHLDKTMQMDPANNAQALPALGGVAAVESQTELETLLNAWFARFYAALAATSASEIRRGFKTHDGVFAPSTRHRLKQIHDALACARILCLTQIQRTGARAINREMHRNFAALRDPKYAQTGSAPPEFMPLEPIMVTTNHYDLNLFNGDTGFIARVDGRACALFPRAGGDFRPVPLAQIRPILQLAYATSVHKAQGSEFQHIALILPPEDISLLTRELLYTGITRASKSVTLFDPSALFGVGAARPLRRYTGLQSLLYSS